MLFLSCDAVRTNISYQPMARN